MFFSRSFHTATLLPNGKILVAGGNCSHEGSLAATEVYHPATGTWTLAKTMPGPRHWHNATLLKTGRVLVCGGATDGMREALGTSLLFDPNPAGASTP
jgi:hypothetical protein